MQAGAREFVKRLEARIAVAMSRATRGEAAAAAGANHHTELNAAPIAASNTPTFASSAFVSQSGHVKITVYATLTASGGTLAALDTLQLTILRDGVTQVGGFATTTVEANATGSYFVSYSFDDTVTVGTSHSWSAVVTVGNAHTAGIPANGCTIRVQDYSAG